MRKYSGEVQTWTVTRPICCSSTSLNNPPSVFLGEKSCNQILIPEAQTRWWELKSWRSLDFFFPCLSPLLVCLCFLLFLFVLSPSLSSLLSSCAPLPPSGCWWCTVSGNQGNWPGAQSQGPSKSKGLFSQLHAEREGGECWNGKKEKEEAARGNRDMVVLEWRRGPHFSLNCFKNISALVQVLLWEIGSWRKCLRCLSASQKEIHAHFRHCIYGVDAVIGRFMQRRKVVSQSIQPSYR